MSVFSSCEENGQPVLIESNKGILNVYIWSDINKEDHTHHVCLEDAKVSMRNRSNSH